MKIIRVNTLQKASLVLSFSLLAACAGNNTKDIADETYDDDIYSEQAADTTTDGTDGYDQTGYRDDNVYSETGSYSQSNTANAVNLTTIFYFDFDQSLLTPETRAALDMHIDYLQYDNRAIRLEGHADERGTREYNMALGERRAKAVANYLVSRGIDRNRIETISYGEERPLAYGSSESALQQNRRVELK